MPGGDSTGPWGLGPRTGRRAGFCSGFPMPGFLNRFVFPPFGGRWFGLWFGLMFRHRRGRRFGWRFWRW